MLFVAVTLLALASTASGVVSSTSHKNHRSNAQQSIERYSIIPRRSSLRRATVTDSNAFPHDNKNERRIQSSNSTTTASNQSESPQLASFDGDLNAIQEMALLKAKKDMQNDTSKYFVCDNQEPVHLDILTFLYSIETVRNALISVVYGEVQEATLETIAPIVLSCENQTNQNKSIVAMDTEIPSSIVADGACPPNQHCVLHHPLRNAILS
jgi:hypothetical protein